MNVVISPPSLGVTITGNNQRITTTISTSGTRGADGTNGTNGADGISGAGYIHTQGTPSSIWVIPHNLGYYPSVDIVDSAGQEWEAGVVHDSNMQVTITFDPSIVFSGTARLT